MSSDISYLSQSNWCQWKWSRESMHEWYFQDNDLYESIVIFRNRCVIHCKLAWTIMDNSNYFRPMSFQTLSRRLRSISWITTDVSELQRVDNHKQPEQYSLFRVYSYPLWTLNVHNNSRKATRNSDMRVVTFYSLVIDMCEIYRT
jgi:hypothetical protein